MAKLKRIIKILSSLFALVLVFGVCCSFVGCKSAEEENKKSVQNIYLKVESSRREQFTLGKNNGSREKSLEYDYQRSGTVGFKAEAFYENGEKCLVQSFISFRQRTIRLRNPGLYVIEQIYTDIEGGPDVVFRLNIRVKEKPDNRPIPIIEILPDENCVSYEMNKRYVYKYNGERQMPRIFNVYEPREPMFLFNTLPVEKCVIENVKLIEGNIANVCFVDVGIYQFDLYVNVPDNGIGVDAGFYQAVWIKDIIIEIVE